MSPSVSIRMQETKDVGEMFALCYGESSQAGRFIKNYTLNRRRSGHCFHTKIQLTSSERHHQNSKFSTPPLLPTSIRTEPEDHIYQFQLSVKFVVTYAMIVMADEFPKAERNSIWLRAESGWSHRDRERKKKKEIERNTFDWNSFSVVLIPGKGRTGNECVCRSRVKCFYRNRVTGNTRGKTRFSQIEQRFLATSTSVETWYTPAYHYAIN